MSYRLAAVILGVVTITLAVVAVAPRIAAAGPRVKWDVPHSWLPLSAADKQHVLALAREAGISEPAHVGVVMDSAPMGCPSLEVESPRLRTGQQRTWSSVVIRGRTPKLWQEDCEPRTPNPANPHHPWVRVYAPRTHTEWMFDDGAWHHALALRDVSYEEAAPLVRALHRKQLVDIRAEGSFAHERTGRLPVGRDTKRVTLIAKGRLGRWAVILGHPYGALTYEIDLRDGRYVVVASLEMMV